jgi:diaminohydroxyphosphoribosylaminopyrimidine deaminase/5-amino-6-(5-phosphoribosylamino)uracil reductase
MAQAIALGALAEGRTSPNPRVGCLLVAGDRVIGRGFHRAPGRPHAEAMAVEEARERARGATLYVNLEPCAHHGRTPPCTELLIRSGVRRVVASMQDPNPVVNGKGFEELRCAGVEVDVGLLGDEALRLNEPFVHWHVHGRPLVTLKAASSADGMLAAAHGASQWITGRLARRFAHRLRWRHDAILVGAETVRRDNPRLTVRLDGETVRRRVVLSPSLRLDPDARVFRGGREGEPPTRVYTSEGAPEERLERLAVRAEIVRVPSDGEGLSLRAVVEDLGRSGVQSLLVEGGARTLAAFLSEGLAGRAALFTSGRLLGARGGTPMLDGPAVATPDRGWKVSRDQVVPLGADVLVLGRLERPADEGVDGSGTETEG